MIHSIVHQDNINFGQRQCVTDSILVQRNSINDCDCGGEHARQNIENHIISPKGQLKKAVKILFVRDGMSKDVVALYSIFGTETEVLCLPQQVPVVHHKPHNVATEVSTGIVGSLCVC